MENSRRTVTGPLVLGNSWAADTVIFMALIAWRTCWTSHEDDREISSGRERRMYRTANRTTDLKITSWRALIITTAHVPGVCVLIVELYVYQGLKHF